MNTLFVVTMPVESGVEVMGIYTSHKLADEAIAAQIKKDTALGKKALAAHNNYSVEEVQHRLFELLKNLFYERI